MSTEKIQITSIECSIDDDYEACPPKEPSFVWLPWGSGSAEIQVDGEPYTINFQIECDEPQNPLPAVDVQKRHRGYGGDWLAYSVASEFSGDFPEELFDEIYDAINSSAAVQACITQMREDAFLRASDIL